MIPLILVSNNKKNIDDFIKKQSVKDRKVIIKIAPEKTEFTIGQIKEIIKEIKISQPFFRIYVLEDFNLSSLEAQNAFLKTLEESPTNIQFILTTVTLHRLLPTILSRSKICYLDKPLTISINKETEGIINQFLKDKTLKIMAHHDFVVSSKEQASQIINCLIAFFRQRLISDKKAPSIIKEILKTKGFLENNNLHNQLAIDHLLIFIRSVYS